jgi:hypothetical protein
LGFSDFVDPDPYWESRSGSRGKKILNKFVPIRAERKNHRMIQARNVRMLILWKMREIEFLQICMSFRRQTATEKVGLALKGNFYEKVGSFIRKNLDNFYFRRMY